MVQSTNDMQQENIYCIGGLRVQQSWARRLHPRSDVTPHPGRAGESDKRVVPHTALSLGRAHCDTARPVGRWDLEPWPV